MSVLIKRIEKLRASIFEACESSNRDPKQIELLPISKHQPITIMQDAANFGFTKFGENYVQEATQKSKLNSDLTFVLTGPLQNNKAKQALTIFQEIMTVDRPALVERLDKLTEQLNIVRTVWIQVNLWNESTKTSGCNIAELELILKMLEQTPRLTIKGFMAVPPPMDIQAFRTMASLRNVWQQKLGSGLKLSIGMSTDFKQAIENGSDQIRVGTAFFGARNLD
jgi:hypothetical protein